VTRYLLDTNVVSEATKPQPSESVIKWLAEQVDTNLFIATLTLAEIWRGILQKPTGRKRRDLEVWFEGADGPGAQFRNRILPFDEAAALEWSRMMAKGTATGRPRGALDMIIAATAAANDCVVVTLNERHFEGAVKVFNPMRIVG
jgi:predicted nucleic acid-binding protein